MRARAVILLFVGSCLASPQAFAPAPRQGGARPPERVWREVPLVVRFDRTGDGRLDPAERQAARAHLDSQPDLRPPARRTRLGPGSPGPRVSPADVPAYPASVPLYDARTLRTLFLEFPADDWEDELAAFWLTDVDIPATLRVDGVAYPGTGVHFRGHNSFLAVPAGRKRALTLSPDFEHPAQRLLGYRGLHLLNGYVDPTFVRGVLYLHVAREYIPAPRANFVRLIINGESWGIYVNKQRFDTDFLRDHFGTTRGTRWKSLNNAPGGGLSYLGEELAHYREAYEIKSRDEATAWTALVRLCRLLHETPPERLGQALEPILDVDAALRFLALDNTFMNGDGYWEDGSDFNIYLAPDGRFRFVPYDVNEAFRPLGGRGGGGVDLDPFAMAGDPAKPLIGKLLAAPDLRARYLAYVRELAETWLDWRRLEPIVRQYHSLIAEEVARDTRKLYSTEEFAAGLEGSPGGSPPVTTLRGFVDARRAYLLAHPDVRQAPRR